MFDEEERLEELTESMDDDNSSPDSTEKKDPILEYLGSDKIVDFPVVTARYYGDLLSHTFSTYIKTAGWKTVKVTGNNGFKPRYRSMSVSPGKLATILTRGFTFLKKGDARLVVQVISCPGSAEAVLVVFGATRNKKDAKSFVKDINQLLGKKNPYQGQKLKFYGRIGYLEIAERNWDSVALDPGLKHELEVNTVGFLKRKDKLAAYGIPSKRGIILVGPPGTGKTLISKVLMSNSPGITCIAADASLLCSSGYISELYALAHDLRPTILFLEDIDLVGEDRGESHYSRASIMSELLAELDGVEECDGVVTLATTNCIEVLDSALAERPSRFDRVIHVGLPDMEQRGVLVRKLSDRIPLDEATQRYIIEKTENYTPAQVQEVMYSMVVEYPEYDDITHKQYSIEEVNNVLNKVKQKNAGRLGFGNGSALQDGTVRYTGYGSRNEKS